MGAQKNKGNRKKIMGSGQNISKVKMTKKKKIILIGSGLLLGAAAISGAAVGISSRYNKSVKQLTYENWDEIQIIRDRLKELDRLYEEDQRLHKNIENYYSQLDEIRKRILVLENTNTNSDLKENLKELESDISFIKERSKKLGTEDKKTSQEWEALSKKIEWIEKLVEKLESFEENNSKNIGNLVTKNELKNLINSFNSYRDGLYEEIDTLKRIIRSQLINWKIRQSEDIDANARLINNNNVEIQALWNNLIDISLDTKKLKNSLQEAIKKAEQDLRESNKHLPVLIGNTIDLKLQNNK